jgi:tetratricopeptide (TPR) repeat protein
MTIRSLRPLALFAAILSGCLACHRVHGQADQTLRAAVDKALSIPGYDRKIFQDLGKLPPAERAGLLGTFCQATSIRMRMQALEELTAMEPKDAAKAVRAFAKDEIVDVSVLAYAYLYFRTGDEDAKPHLVESLAAKKFVTAMAAAKCVARFVDEKGNNALLAELLLSPTHPPKVRYEAMVSAGTHRNRAALPPLFRLLADTTPLKRTPTDTARLCDYAAQSIGRIYGARRVPADTYYRAELAVRDQAIAKWQAWGAKQMDLLTADPSADVAADVAREALALFATGTGDAKAGRAAIVLAAAGNMCLGILPGIDRVILPSVRDQFRVLSVLGKEKGRGEVQHWDALDLRLRREFLPKHPDLEGSGEDTQAAAFIQFLVESPRQTGHRFPLDWAWSFCRSFPEVFPASKHRAEVAGYADRIRERIRQQNQRIVMHGTIPELEPIPVPEAPPKPGGMVQIGLGAISRKYQNEPSEWRHYRDAVAYLAESVARRRAAGKQVAPHPLFENQMIGTYPANEVPLLGEAALYLRVWEDPATALAYANKAKILNPQNPKVQAILGMICRQFDPPRDDQAFAALQEAVRLGPKSLGGEPESAQTIAFYLLQVRKRDGEKAFEEARKKLADVLPGSPAPAK